MTSDEAHTILKTLPHLIAAKKRELDALTSRRNAAIKTLAPHYSERKLGAMAGVKGQYVHKIKGK